MRRYFTEFAGTFFLVLTVAAAVMNGAALAPLAIGAVLVVMVFAGGYVSGAHYNPAVTVAVFIRGRITFTDAAAYVIAQLLGEALAAVTATWLVNPAPSAPLAFSGRATAAATHKKIA